MKARHSCEVSRGAAEWMRLALRRRTGSVYIRGATRARLHRTALTATSTRSRATRPHILRGAAAATVDADLLTMGALLTRFYGTTTPYPCNLDMSSLRTVFSTDGKCYMWNVVSAYPYVV